MATGIEQSSTGGASHDPLVPIANKGHPVCDRGDHVWLYNPRKKRGLTLKLQSNWEGLYTILQRLLAVTATLGDGTRKRPRMVYVDRLGVAGEEGHFTWCRQGPPSTPDSEVGSVNEV